MNIEKIQKRAIKLVIKLCNKSYEDRLKLKHLNLPTLKYRRSPYSIAERRVPELIPVLGSQPAGDVSHKPGGRLPLLSASPALTLATLKKAATNIAAGLSHNPARPTIHLYLSTWQHGALQFFLYYYCTWVTSLLNVK